MSQATFKYAVDELRVIAEQQRLRLRRSGRLLVMVVILVAFWVGILFGYGLHRVQHSPRACWNAPCISTMGKGVER